MTRRAEPEPLPWALLYHRATVVFGRTDRQFWRMTIAQLALLAGVQWPTAGQAAGPEPERGTAADLFALARLQK